MGSSTSALVGNASTGAASISVPADQPFTVSLEVSSTSIPRYKLSRSDHDESSTTAKHCESFTTAKHYGWCICRLSQHKLYLDLKRSFFSHIRPAYAQFQHKYSSCYPAVSSCSSRRLSEMQRRRVRFQPHNNIEWLFLLRTPLRAKTLGLATSGRDLSALQTIAAAGYGSALVESMCLLGVVFL